MCARTSRYPDNLATISVFPMSVLTMVIIAPRTHGEHARNADISL